MNRQKKQKKSQATHFQEEEEVEQEKTDEFTLYKLLNVEKSATDNEIKKSYRLLALKFHPDKNQGNEEAKAMFQKINEAYQILSNPEKKKVYDQTGQVDNEEQFCQAYEFYRSLFPKIEVNDIDDFERKYRFGPMEQEDLIEFYNRLKGNMTLLLENIPLSKNEDVSRFIEFYDEKIKRKELTHFKIYDTTKKKVKLLKDESGEAEQHKSSLQSLQQNILAKRTQSFDKMLEQMEAKYKPRKQKQPQPSNVEEEIKVKKRLKKK